jgi:hypothetical protein
MVSRLHRRRGASAILAGAAFLTAAQVAYAVDPNPLENAYWRFEEGTPGNTVDSTTDNVVTDSANANHMRTADGGAGAPTYSSTVSTPIVPQTGAANAVSMQFSGNKDLYTNLKHINHPIISTGFTLEASFKLDSPGTGYQCIIGKDGQPTASSLAPLELKVRGDGGKLQIEILDGGGTERQVSSPSALSSGQWYHTAVVDTGTALSLYLDSSDGNGYVLQGTTALAGGALVDKDSPWSIGRGMYNNAPTDWITGTVQEVRLSNTTLDPSKFLFAPANTKWNVNADGNWSTPGSWQDNSIPRVAGATANLTDGITASHTVNVDIPVTVGSMNFDNASSYVVAGAQTITIDTVSGSGAINVLSGNHTIAAPVTLAKDTTATIAGASTLALTGNLTATGVTLSKQGDGTLQTTNVRATGLNVSGGVVRIAPSGAAGGVSRVAQLSVSGNGRLDLTNNKLVVTAAGSANALTALIASGRNGGGWAGNGIVTSQTQATTSNFTTLGVATAAQVKGVAATATATWAGQTVTGSDSLVMYTYGGDANLDGKINVDDYTRIDFNVPLGATGWYNGDFNYDGKINVDDYTIIDFNVGIQGAPFFTGAGGLSTTAVPEPAAFSVIALMVLAGRRRKSPS